MVTEALSCHGELFRVWANTSLPMQLQVGQPGGGEAAVLIQTAVMGIGDEIMHP